MITTSALYSTVPFISPLSGLGRFFKTSGSAPASETASATPFKTPRLVSEAPDTASTLSVCPEMICSGIRCQTVSAIPMVSPLVSISIFSILFSEKVTFIGTWLL